MVYQEFFRISFSSVLMSNEILLNVRNMCELGEFFKFDSNQSCMQMLLKFSFLINYLEPIFCLVNYFLTF